MMKTNGFGWLYQAQAALWTLIVAIWPMVAVAQGASEEDWVRQNLKKIIPDGVAITSVDQTPFEGVYYVRVRGEHWYVYSRDEFIMIGEVYDTDRRISWTRERKEKEHQMALLELDVWPENRMIIMGDPDGERYVTVFTDTDCGWCQKFHRDIPMLKEAGLKVRYLMWPRAGIDSDSYQEAVAVWCADDQGNAMTIAKAGQEIERKVCENPVEEHYELGFRLGVQGTPYILLDNGQVLGGYVPPEEILAEAGLMSMDG